MRLIMMIIIIMTVRTCVCLCKTIDSNGTILHFIIMILSNTVKSIITLTMIRTRLASDHTIFHVLTRMMYNFIERKKSHHQTPHYHLQQQQDPEQQQQKYYTDKSQIEQNK